MFSPYHAAGFYCAPVSKAVLGSVVLSSVAFIIPLSNYRFWFLAPVTSLRGSSQVVRYLCKRLVFLDPKDVMCASILLYHFRIFERRYGSRKFSSFLLASWLLSLLLEPIMLAACQHLNLNIEPLPTGPYGLVFALFVPYFTSIPRVAMTYILGIPVTGKSLTYILGLQMASGSVESALLAACGIVAGLLYHNNALFVERWLCVPSMLATVTHHLVGGVFSTAPPPSMSQPMGATLELQRAQHIEQLEQQMAWAQLQHRPQGGGGGFGGFGGLFGGAGRGLQNHAPPPPPPSGAPPEEEVQRLVEMGFQRDTVLTAMQSTRNNVNDAMNLLLRQA